jgi:hypothetical protein
MIAADMQLADRNNICLWDTHTVQTQLLKTYEKMAEQSKKPILPTTLHLPPNSIILEMV